MTTTPPRRVRWWLLVPGLALDLVAVWVLATAWGPVTAGHPAYLVTLVAAALLGAVLVVAARLTPAGRRPPPHGPPPGPAPGAPGP